MPSGVQITQVGDLKLFHFSEDLQARSDELLERSKAGVLTSDEAAELAGISELSRIFTFINAQLAAQAE